jgi:carbon storage regulator
LIHRETAEMRESPPEFEWRLDHPAFCNGGTAMLVLTRKNLESVVVLPVHGVEPTLRITVLEIKGNSVRLGFVAADKVPIHRSEVWERIRIGHPPGSPKRGPPTPVGT